MAFVITTVSTTDYTPTTPIETYDIYLKPVGQRTSAWWSPHASDAQMWETREEAQAEWDRVFTGKRESSKVKELCEGWRPQSFAHPVTGEKEWFIVNDGMHRGPYLDRPSARIEARAINEELKKVLGVALY
jgi:hypothetical protein